MIETKNIRIIHLAFCGAIVLFGAVTMLLISDNLFFAIEFTIEAPLVMVAIVLAILSISLSNFIYNYLIGQIDQMASPAAKFQKYQVAFLVKCALLEGAALFNIAVCLVGQNSFTLLFAAVCLMVLWLNRPTKNHISNALKLQESELN